MRPLDFTEEKAFKRWEAFDHDLAMYQTDIPTLTPDTFWLHINKLIQQDKVFIKNDMLHLNHNNSHKAFE